MNTSATPMQVNGQDIDYTALPEHLRDGFRRYIEHRIPMGSFGMGVLRNDLLLAILRASPESVAALPRVIKWLLENAPAECWGSPERVNAWLAQRVAA